MSACSPACSSTYLPAHSAQPQRRFAWLLIVFSMMRAPGRQPEMRLDPGMGAWLRRDVGLLPAEMHPRDRLLADPQAGMIR
jgi:hypothetical protein